MINTYSVLIRPLPAEASMRYEAFYTELGRQAIVGEGKTHADALVDLIDKVADFLTGLAETGQTLEQMEYSGKFNVRVSKMLHSKLALHAEEQHVTLNSFVQTALATAATALEAKHEFSAVDFIQATTNPSYPQTDNSLTVMPVLLEEGDTETVQEESMDRKSTYEKFWRTLVARAISRITQAFERLPETEANARNRRILQQALTVHQRMASRSQAHFLDANYDGRLYRYNIYWDKFPFACACIGRTGERPNEADITYVHHTYGALRIMVPGNWPTVQDLLIDAMLARLQELV